jgi:hypothetical protein
MIITYIIEDWDPMYALMASGEVIELVLILN